MCPADQPDIDHPMGAGNNEEHVVNHYNLLEKIGSGGMGEVWLAEDTRLDRKVALKFLPYHAAQDEVEKARFFQEAKAAARLNHANIAQVYEIGEDKGRLYIVMEYVGGGSLRDHLDDARGRALPLESVLEWIQQAAEGLVAAHKQGVIHRDIKPDNLMITDSGELKITDFGLARLETTTRLTAEGATLGTVNYMSPEQVVGKELDSRSDLFSLGATLYEMLSGQKPFDGPDAAAIYYSLLHDDPDPVVRYRKDVEPAFENIVTKLLEKDPRLRYQSAEEVVTDLQRAGLTGSTGKRADRSKRSLLPTTLRNFASQNPVLSGLLAVTVVLAVLLIGFNPGTERGYSPGLDESGAGGRAETDLEEIMIAVVDLVADNVDTGEVLAITKRLREHLRDQGIFNVLESAMMEEILEEQGLLLGRSNIHAENLARAGKALGVRKMVTGSVSKVGQIYSLHARIMDTQTLHFDLRTYKDVTSIEDVLTGATRDVALEFAEVISQRLTAQVEEEEQTQEPVYPEGSGQSITVEGISTIIAGDTGKARDDAINNALDKAVERVVDSFVSSQSLAENSILVQDRIYTKTSGYITAYETQGFVEEAEVFRVTVRVDVNKAALFRDLEGIGLVPARSTFPRLLVLADEEIYLDELATERVPVTIDAGTSTTTLLETLIPRGFRFVDPTAMAVNTDARVLSAALGGDLNQAMVMGRAYQADLIILVKALVNRDMGVQYVSGSQVAMRASVSIRALRSDTGEIIATSGTTKTAAGVGAVSVGQSAIRMATEDAIPSLEFMILERWAREVSSGAIVELVVSNSIEYSDLQRFQQLLPYYIRECENVVIRSFIEGIATLEVSFRGTSLDLASELATVVWEEFDIEVAGMTSNQIRIRVIPK
ncbi:serine/threonine-protein kinase [Gemmatimonadota bacterium]